jgi:hypothetical protein
MMFCSTSFSVYDLLEQILLLATAVCVGSLKSYDFKVISKKILKFLEVLGMICAVTSILYYYQISGSQVVIFKGVPGAVLGWDPTVDRRTGLALAALTQVDRDRVRTNATRGSLATVQAYVDRLQAATTTVPAPATTTTLLRPTTTRPTIPVAPSTAPPP